MNLGIDFDGVIADSAVLKRRYVRERLGIEVSLAKTSKSVLSGIIGAAAYRQMIKEVYDSPTTLSIPAVKGAQEALRRLGKSHTITIITARKTSEGKWAEKWLEKHGIKYATLAMTSNRSKRQMCIEHGIDAMIEDTPENLSDLPRSVRKLLLARPYVSKEVPRGVTIVKDWAEIIRHVMSSEGRSGRRSR